MLQRPSAKLLSRKDDRIIIHFDYDCFYASVVENENPALRTLPLAIQQKQIIVTCNYAARQRGLYKLQLIVEAKKTCPEVVIVLGEDLTRFRNASKDLYNLVRSFSWNDKVERLGFDEVWMDVTDIVDYNLSMLNPHDLGASFFQLSSQDPTSGFSFDARTYAGHVWPKPSDGLTKPESHFERRLMLGSHLALYIRHILEEKKGYTCTVGISTSKLLSKLIGNVNKPKGQTTLLPPYELSQHDTSNVVSFLDSHDIGAIPGIGFKLAQKIREHFLGRRAEYDVGLVYGGSKEKVTVGDVRQMPELTPTALETLLSGPGAPHGIGQRIYSLIHGVDDTEVSEARNVPRQISIEDSYIRLDTMDEVLRELKSASERLVERMRIDLTEPDDTSGVTQGQLRWIGRPETLRLSTRPRQPVGADGKRPRTFARISRSSPLPQFAFNLDEHLEAIAERLVKESLVPLFKRLHPEKSGWNLSLMNVAVTNMVDVGTTSKASVGRDIQALFNRQEEHLKDFRVDTVASPLLNAGEEDTEPESNMAAGVTTSGPWDDSADDEDGEDNSVSGYYCTRCSMTMPEFARVAHERFHQK